MTTTFIKSYSVEEYLQQEEQAETKSEYFNGRIYSVTSENLNHNQILGNVSAELLTIFKYQNYFVYAATLSLWIPEPQKMTYPDVMVIAGKPDYYENRKDTVTNPLIIIEVLSKSTQDYDKQDKFVLYRTLPSLQEYILISQTQVQIGQYVKLENKRWSFQEYDQQAQSIKLHSVNIELSLEDIYHKVQWEE